MLQASVTVTIGLLLDVYYYYYVLCDRTIELPAQTKIVFRARTTYSTGYYNTKPCASKREIIPNKHCEDKDEQ